MAVLPNILWRCVTVGLGAISLYWGATFFSTFWFDDPIVRMANRISSGETFRPAQLSAFVPALTAINAAGRCHPSALHGATILRLKIAENAMSDGDNLALDGDLKSLRDTIDLAIACAPTDSLLWLGRYWLDNVENGFNSKNLDILRMSYSFGPNEAWIALKRNRLAWAVYERLPGDMKKMVLSEFMMLTNSNLIPDAVDIFTGPAWKSKDDIIPGLEEMPSDRKMQFVRWMNATDHDFSLRGLERSDARPWRP